MNNSRWMSVNFLMIRNFLIIPVFFLFNYLNADCSDLDSTECIQWAEYCEWNEETDECQDIGESGDIEYGPYEFSFITQSDGMRDGPEYADATLYYPIGVQTPLTSIIIGAGWSGSGEDMWEWAYLFSSHGFIAVTINYNDPVNESHQDRAIAMLDLIETVKQENTRAESPVFDQIDTNEFAAAGYSISGGGVQLAAVLDSTLDAVIALNPTIIVEDCDGCADHDYCICLLPEHLDHNVPVLIISGENEIDELPDYEGLLGSDQYMNTPETTIKMLYEVAYGDHGSANPALESVRDKVVNWVKYHLMDSTDLCNLLLHEPDDASQFLTTLTCMTLPSYDINDDGTVDNADLVMLISIVINELMSESDINYDLSVDIHDILILSDYLDGI
jgi:dienelactone hydrolase